MPELPEMKALAERLTAAIGSAPLARIDALSFSGLKTVHPDPSTLFHRPLVHAGTRGKYLVLDFTGPRMLVHLSQGGRVDLESPPKATRPKGAVARMLFEPSPGILIKEFGTERKAGWWVLAAGDEGPLGLLGPEPFDDAFVAFISSGEDRRRVHTILRDQRTVAGIGRGYTDDILHTAQISPFALLASLNAAKRARLVKSVRDVLEEGLALERKRTGGLPAKLGDHWIVHHRHGEPCPRCNATLLRVSYEAYEVTYCPVCQTGGQILADRRMSRLLK